jgi:hypothetical protein
MVQSTLVAAAWVFCFLCIIAITATLCDTCTLFRGVIESLLQSGYLPDVLLLTWSQTCRSHQYSAARTADQDHDGYVHGIFEWTRSLVFRIHVSSPAELGILLITFQGSQNDIPVRALHSTQSNASAKVPTTILHFLWLWGWPSMSLWIICAFPMSGS